MRHREQRNLPSNATLLVRIIMEFVHHDVTHIGVRSLSQGNVRKNLRGAAKNRRVAIHRGIARRHTDAFRTEIPGKREELFIHERFDGAGINRSTPSSERLEMKESCDERFARAGRCVQDDILFLEQFKNRLFLCVVRNEILLFDVAEERIEDGVGMKLL